MYEKFSEVLNFVQENLEHAGLPFVLSLPTGHKLEESDRDSTLAQLKLVPATILTFQWDASIGDELTTASSYLKPEIMMLMQTINWTFHTRLIYKDMIIIYTLVHCLFLLLYSAHQDPIYSIQAVPIYLLNYDMYIVAEDANDVYFMNFK